MRGRSLFIMFTLLASAFLVGTTVPPSARAATLYVGGSGPGNYTTIQAAIDAAHPGDTVYVYKGTYYESLEISKTLSLKGENRDTTIVDRASPGDVIVISADWVNISGFTVKNSAFDSDDVGILLRIVKHCRLSDNNIISNWYGIFLRYSESVTIADNVFGTQNANHDRSIRLYFSDYNLVINNDAPDGVWLEVSGKNTITDNIVSSFYIWASDDNAITNNTGWSTYGIWFSSRNVIAENILSGKHASIFLDNSTNNIIRGNAISNSRWEISMSNSGDNKVFHNNFMDDQVWVRGSKWYPPCPYHNVWDNGYPSGGNYWGSYKGVDEFSGPNQDQPGSDGIGDDPVGILIDMPDWEWEWDYDRYPLVEPFLPPPAPPSAPLGLSAMAAGRKVTLKWKPPLFDGGSPITNYTIYRGTAPGGETFLVEVGNVTNYTDRGLTLGVTYYYRVSAKNIYGEGTKSSEVSVTLLPFTLPSDLVGIRMWGEEPSPICAVASDIMARDTHEALAYPPRPPSETPEWSKG